MRKCVFILAIMLPCLLHAYSARISFDQLMRNADAGGVGLVLRHKVILHTPDKILCRFDIAMQQTTYGGNWPPDQYFYLMPKTVIYHLVYETDSIQDTISALEHYAIVLKRTFSISGWELANHYYDTAFFAQSSMPFVSSDIVWYEDFTDPHRGISTKVSSSEGKWNVTRTYSQSGLMLSEYKYSRDNLILRYKSRNVSYYHDGSMQNKSTTHSRLLFHRRRLIRWTFYSNGQVHISRHSRRDFY
jgi:hypothetical protein